MTDLPMNPRPAPGLADIRSSSPIQAVIFDMDGVLTDSEPLINAAAIAMFGELGLTVQSADFQPFVGTGENRYLGGVAEKYGFAVDLPAAKRRTYEIYLGLVPGQLHAFRGAVELVQCCRAARLRTAVASSADWVKIEANLLKINLAPATWDTVVTGDDVEHKKPAPDLFLAAASRLGLRPSQCVVIEDAPNGVEAARAAGMRCVAVAQTFPPEHLDRASVIRATIADVGLEDLLGN
jgi:beta-phosphoglucomutase